MHFKTFEVSRDGAAETNRQDLTQTWVRGGIHPKPGEPPAKQLALGKAFVKSESELLNRTDRQVFLVVNDRAGVEDMKRRGLVPSPLSGGWGPFFPFDRNAGVNRDFNMEFVVGIYDRQRPTTGYRAYIEDTVARANSLEVLVRFASPPPGLAVAQKPTSPYFLVVLDREEIFQSDKPIEVRFIAEGKVVNTQTVVLRGRGQGVVALAISPD